MGTATISACGRYRYSLDRLTGLDDIRTLLWIMLNPSTADASKDDPTIRKVVGFTKRAGYGRAVVVNLYALRATNPAEVKRDQGIAIGPMNDRVICFEAFTANDIVAAWGAKSWAESRARRVIEMVREQTPRPILRLQGDGGGPTYHPLFVRYETRFEPLPG